MNIAAQCLLIGLILGIILCAVSWSFWTDYREHQRQARRYAASRRRSVLRRIA